jgi:hypothetical protein
MNHSVSTRPKMWPSCLRNSPVFSASDFRFPPTVRAKADGLLFEKCADCFGSFVNFVSELFALCLEVRYFGAKDRLIEPCIAKVPQQLRVVRPSTRKLKLEHRDVWSFWRWSCVSPRRSGRNLFLNQPAPTRDRGFRGELFVGGLLRFADESALMPVSPPNCRGLRYQPLAVCKSCRLQFGRFAECPHIAFGDPELGSSFPGREPSGKFSGFHIDLNPSALLQQRRSAFLRTRLRVSHHSLAIESLDPTGTRSCPRGCKYGTINHTTLIAPRNPARIHGFRCTAKPAVSPQKLGSWPKCSLKSAPALRRWTTQRVAR